MNYSKSKKKTPKMKEMPAGERPREKIISNGVFSLSNAELIAVLFALAQENFKQLVACIVREVEELVEAGC